MARKNDTPQKAAMRELMSGYLKQNNVKIKDGTDVNAIMRDMMSVILEGALDETAIPRRPGTPAMETWRLISHGTEKGNTNLR